MSNFESRKFFQCIYWNETNFVHVSEYISQLVVLSYVIGQFSVQNLKTKVEPVLFWEDKKATIQQFVEE